MISIEIRDYKTADLLFLFIKSYLPITNSTILKIEEHNYLIVETVLDLVNDGLTYYVIEDN